MAAQEGLRTHAQIRIQAKATRVQTAFAANPNSPIAQWEAVAMLSELGRTAQARQLLAVIVAASPGDCFTCLRQADLLLQSEDRASWAESLTSAREAERASPGSAQAPIARAMLLLGQATEIDREALRGEYRLLLSKVEHTLDNKSASATELANFLRQYHSRPAGAMVAEVHAWRGNADLALKCLESAIDVDIHDSFLARVPHSPFFAAARSHQRWLEVLGRMNRAPAQLARIEFEIRVPVPRAVKPSEAAQAWD